LFGTVSYQQQNLGGNNQNLGAELQIGQRELLFDVRFTDPWIAGDPTELPTQSMPSDVGRFR